MRVVGPAAVWAWEVVVLDLEELEIVGLEGAAPVVGSEVVPAGVVAASREEPLGMEEQVMLDCVKYRRIVAEALEGGQTTKPFVATMPVNRLSLLKEMSNRGVAGPAEVAEAALVHGLMVRVSMVMDHPLMILQDSVRVQLNSASTRRPISRTVLHFS